MHWPTSRLVERWSTRALIACGAGALAAAVSVLVQRMAPARLSDIGILLDVSRGYLHGQNPYDVMGPGRSIEFPELMAYPFTEVLLLAPFAMLPSEPSPKSSTYDNAEASDGIRASATAVSAPLPASPCTVPTSNGRSAMVVRPTWTWALGPSWRWPRAPCA